jgi:hypothetical protein
VLVNGHNRAGRGMDGPCPTGCSIQMDTWTGIDAHVFTCLLVRVKPISCHIPGYAVLRLS